ncbi:MAG: hypothetical protein ACK4ZJ_19915, partial [Allorhizobium sp.]
MFALLGRFFEYFFPSDLEKLEFRSNGSNLGASFGHADWTSPRQSPRYITTPKQDLGRGNPLFTKKTLFAALYTSA